LNKTKNQKQTDQDMLRRVREDTDVALREIYQQYRTPFLNWSFSTFNLDKNTALDIFQEVVMAFYKNVITLKLQNLDASLKSYLFTIGKYKILNRYQKKQIKNETLLDDFSHMTLADWDMATSETQEKSSAEEKMIAAFKLLGEKCSQLLKLFYFENLSHQEIVNRMGYNTAEVSRSMKRKCIRKLRSLVSEI